MQKLVTTLIFGLVLCVATGGPASGQGTTSVRECLGYVAKPPSVGFEPSERKGLQSWLAVCRQAVQDDPADPRLKTSLASALAADGQRAEAVAMYRAAAAQNDA